MGEGLSKSHDENPWAKEYEDDQSKKKRTDILNMQWTPGDHNIRIMPAKEKGKTPFVKYIVHWIPVKNAVKDRPIIHSVATKCPICKFVGTLWSEVYRLKEEEDMTDKSPEVQKIVKQISKIKGKKTYDMNIIHREDYKDEKGQIKIKRLVAGPTIWKSILELGNSTKWGNPSAADDRGYDLTVTVDGEGIKREYTIMPDPDRKALTDDEKTALKDRGCNLVTLRVMTPNEDVLDVLENAKPPLDTINLKEVRKSMTASEPEADEPAAATDDDDEKPKSRKPADDEDEKPQTRKPAADDDEDEKPQSRKPVDEDEKPQTRKPAADDDDEDEKEPVDANDEREEKAFGKPAADDDDKPTLGSMDCRGTYDAEDVGCQECSLSGECKALRKEFRTKAADLDIEIANMSGVEIEKAIKTAEAKKTSTSKPVGKQGKQGSAPAESTGKKRDLPF
ncbi:MAG: hypothetical protein Q7R33_00830 [Nitrosarchaeum sp.]|nr:hypothetical protein [Nitrosarchaeum sp.]